MKKILSAVGISVVCATSVMAVPQLQLDIAGGTYDNVSETIIAGANPFTLYALYNAANGTPSGSFYISASISPQTDVGNFGSFGINGTTYSSASGMQHGTPPVNVYLDSHSTVFPTYYAQIEFNFDNANRAASYDSQLNPGGLVEDPSGTLVYHAFTVNILGLAPGTILHFDLYNSFLERSIGGDSSFAPFTHDAQSGVSVPDAGASLALLGVGLMGCIIFSRKFGKVC